MSTRGDRWDRDRLDYEKGRGRYDDDKYYMRGGLARDHSDDGYDRRAPPRSYDDEMVRDRRYYDDEPRHAPQREYEYAPEYERRAQPVMERERDRDYYRRDASPRRPAFLRRQSSLDTFDRRPLRQFYEREEYPPPARRGGIYRDDYRDDYRAPTYTDIPLPKTKTKALPAPRRYDDRYYEDIKVAEPERYGDEDYRTYPDRIREREVIRERHDDRRRSPTRSTRSTRTRSQRTSSPSSTTTSRSSSSDGGTTVKDEYPKKGKTRIPGRLVSKRALIDLGYPFTEEGTTVIVQRALGQDNIDELLKLSEEYQKSELEIAAARSSAGNILEDRKEEFVPPPPQPTYAQTQAPAPPPTYAPPPNMPPPPTVAQPPPPAPVPAPAPVPGASYGPIVYDAAPARDSSPSRTTTTTSSYDSSHHHYHRPHRESSAPVPVGPLALAERSRSRSRSRSGREIRAEIRALERELVHRPKRESGERELVKAERLPDGQLVIYEEQVEKVEHSHKPARIEKDKKGPPPRLVRAMLGTLT